MKILQFIEIGTLATPTDYDNQVGELFQIPVTADSTPRIIFERLADDMKNDPDAMIAFGKFMQSQNQETLDKGIFADCDIQLDPEDVNQYYMIFQLITVVNIMENARDASTKSDEVDE